MAWIGILICSIFAFFNYYQDKRIYSASGFFATFWSILMLLSKMRLYHFNKASEYAYLLISFGVISFCIGSTFMRKVKIRNTTCRDSINQNVYNILVVFCLLSLIYNFRIIYVYFTNGLNISTIYYSMAKTTSGEETLLSPLASTWQVRLQQYVGYPLLYTLVPISIIGYVKEHKNKYLFVAIFLSFLRFIFDFRRTYLVIIIAYIGLLLLIRLRSVKMPVWWTRKLKRRILIVGIIMAVGYIEISEARSGSSRDYFNLFSHFYSYYVGSIAYFSQRLDLISNIDYTFGLTSFRGFFAPIFALLGILGFNEPRLMTVATNNIESLHNMVLSVTENGKFNSYATVFLEFFWDGGITGVIILSFLFGFFSQYLYKKCVKFGSMRDEFRYAYFFSLFLLLSVLHFNGSVVCYIWPFIIERLLFCRNANEKMDLQS